MITAYDKAIVAVIMGVLAIINLASGGTGVISQDTQNTVTAVVGGLTPLLVWLVPNKA